MKTKRGTSNYTPPPPIKRNEGGCFGIWVVLFILALLVGGMIYAYLQNIERTDGTTCTANLADIDRALDTLAMENKIQTYHDLQQAIGSAPSYGGLRPYLNNHKLNEVSYYFCPAGGTYIISGQFDPKTSLPMEPECTLANSQRNKFKGTRLHSLQVIK
jgi:hypothetical protein